ncbi:MAG: FecR domain-containing protein [Ferruginibacter sp.]|nr:FecR domain-containing protein [Ferruginibacter sp.]
MLNKKNQLEKLLEKPVWTPEEKQWLLDTLENSGESELKEYMQALFLDNLQHSTVIDRLISEKLLAGIHQKMGVPEKPGRVKRLRFWTLRLAVACFVGLCALTTLWWFNNNSKPRISQTQNNTPLKNDAKPGGDKAILTLGDGSTIVLDEEENGTVLLQGNTKVIKLNGKLNYSDSGLVTNEILYNIISTPSGGQFQVELCDGSKVWLNSVSSLRFPTSFSGKERRVEITGEAYFEIAKNKARPFIVSINGAEIQVLGTHFNVMAYNDESLLQATLLEGSVKFVTDGNSAMLKPGQQAQLSPNGRLQMVSGVDLRKVMAWKNGFFIFEGSDFETVAKQLSRWYDVEVIYDRKINDLFYAEIPRNTKLSDVLKALELTGKVRFKINGKKIIVLT